MKNFTRICLFVGLLLFVQGGLNAQVAVTVTNPANTTPALAASYTSLANAITALSGITAISGPVTLTAAAGSETTPAGGYSISFTAATTATNNVVITGTATTTITASAALTAGALNDAIFKIIGSDYVTIQNFTMQENAANTTTAAATNNMTEWGVALLYLTSTNGAQNCTIQNNNISLVRTYQNTFGIYANATHTAAAPTTSASATTTAGGNTGLKIYNNTISNINNGIVVVGPTAAADQNIGVDIGGTSVGTANNISNYGSNGTFSAYVNVSGTVNGVLVRNSITVNISYNTIASSNGGTTVGTLNGIQVPAASATPTATFTNSINNNNISLRSGVAAGSIVGISYPSGSASVTSTLNINNNDFNTFGHTIAASGTIIFITVTSTNQFTTINTNTFTNISVNTTGSVTFISQSFTAPATGTKSVASNSIVTGFTKTGAGGTITFVVDNGSTVTGAISNCTNNNFSNVTLTGATAITGITYTDGGTAPTRTVTGNILNNWTTGAATINAMNFTYWNGVSSLSTNTITNITGQGVITAITIGSTVNTATSFTIASNTINNLTSTGTGGSVTGLSCTNTSTLININNNAISTLASTGAFAVSGISIGGATTTNVFKNTICDISGSNASSTVNGILVSAGTTVNVYNNTIGDLRTPVANAANPLIGLNITGGTTVNAYYNTIYLAGTSSGALFGSSATSVSTTPTVTFINNIFYNNSSVTGVGLAVAYRRSSTTLTSYGSTSNTNLFFGSTIFTDGTNTDITLAAYKARVASRDAASVTENLTSAPTFLSTTCGNANFLHISPSVATQLESGGTTVSGITDDFDGNTRNVSTPDIGADEFTGTPADFTAPSISAITLVGNACNLTSRNVTAVIGDPSGVDNASFKPRVYFRKNAGAYFSAAGSLTSGTVISGTWTFTINYATVGGVVTTDVIDYFIVAQDVLGNVGGSPPGGLVLTNVNTVTTPPTTPLTYTVQSTISGSYNVGAGQTYTTLSAAIAAYNNSCLGGAVTFLLTDATYTEATGVTINANADASSTNTLTIKPTLTNTTLTGSVASGALIKLNGADYVTIDGSNSGGTDRSLTITNTSTTAPTGISLVSLGTGLGATNNIVKNCNISTGIATSLGYGIAVGGSTPGTNGADNDNVTLQNNAISVASISIYAVGTASVSTGGLDNLLITGNTLTSINGALQNYGIQVGNGLTGSIISNTLTVETTGSVQPVGISLETGFVSSSVTKNTITKVNATAAGGYGGRGITIGTGTASSSLSIANNVIYGVNGSNYLSFSNSSSMGIGIGIIGGSATLTTTTGGINLYFNSVSMSGSMGSGSTTAITTAIYVGSGASALDIRNNVFANTQVGTNASQKNYAVYSAASAPFTIINYNDYFVSNTFNAGSALVGFLTSDRATLASWQSATTQDANSISADPLFNSSTNLSPNPGSPVLAAGVTGTGITTDILGTSRGTPPSIGAYEAAGDFTGPTITYTALTGTLCPTDRTLSATITDASNVNTTAGTKPRLYFKKSTDANTYVGNTSANNGWKYVEATNAASPFSFTTNYALLQSAVTGGDVIQYFVVAQDLAATPNISINSGIFAATPSSVALTAAQFPLTGTINSYTVTGGGIGTDVTIGAAGTYPTLTGVGGLFAALNTGGLTANINATILDASITETGTNALNAINYGCTGTYTLTIKPATGVTATLTGTVSSGALLKLNGADNVTIDGSNSGGTDRSLTITNTSTTSPTGIALVSLGTGSGATNNTIKNCNISTGISTATGYGIAVGGNTPGTSGADNDNTTLQNNNITVATVSIYAVGTASVSTGGNDNLLITGNTVNINTTIQTQGIQVGNGLTGSITGNTISVESSGAVQPVGISIETGFVSSSITKNTITKALATNTGGYAGRGITVGTGTASSNLTIANNIIYGVNGSNWSVFSNSSSMGIALGMIGGSTTVTTVAGGINLYYNSVSMSGSMGSGSTTTVTAALYIGSGVTALDIRNNIFANTQVGTSTTQKNYAVYSTAAAPFTTINYNDYYVTNTFNAGSALVGFLTSDRATLANWQTATGQDALSFASNPQFLSTTNLHINTAVATQVESSGTPIAGTTTDIDGDTRNATTPDVGADEGTFIQVVNNDVQATAFIDPLTGGSKLIGAAFTPSASFTNNGLNDQTNVPVRYRIVDATLTEIYNNTTTIPSLLSGATANVTFASTSLPSAGTYTIYAKAELVGDQVTSNDQIVGTVIAEGPLNGTYLVGATQPAGFQNLTQAIGKLNSLGVSGAVVFSLQSNYSSMGETFPLTINAYAGASATNTFKIRPASGVTATISGTSAVAILKLNGADYVTIDGSNNGTTSQNLTINNTNTGTSSVGVWLASTVAPDGATNNTIKNCIVTGNSATTTFGGIVSSGSTIGSVAEVANSTNTYQNNTVSLAFYGLAVVGPAALESGTVISNNNIGTLTSAIGNDALFISNQNAATVSRNIIQNIVTSVVAASGIFVTGTSIGVVISNNTIKNVASTSIGAGTSSISAISINSATTNTEVNANTITTIASTTTSGYGVRGIIIQGSGTVVKNNMISDIFNYQDALVTSYATLGITIDGAVTGIKIYYNTVNLFGSHPGYSTNTTGGVAACVYVNTSTAGGVDIRNNIFTNSYDNSTSTGDKAYAIYSLSANTVFSNIDYNDYSVSGTGSPVLGFIGSDRITMADIVTGFGGNANSKNVAPVYVSTTNLHLLTNVGINDLGTPIAGITTDIDNDTRSTTAPDMGADEFFAKVAVKVLLGSGTMTRWTANNSVSTFPASDPYLNPPFNGAPLNYVHVGGAPTATIANPAAVLGVTGANGIVDWVFVELRTGTMAATSVVYTKAALVQQDGDIVETDGVTPIGFPVGSGNYYLAVKNRNHIGIRTQNSSALTGVATTVDLTVLANVYGSDPVRQIGMTSSYAMWSGDADANTYVSGLDFNIFDPLNGAVVDEWNQADFDLDGDVDGLDFNLFDLANGLAIQQID